MQKQKAIDRAKKLWALYQSNATENEKEQAKRALDNLVKSHNLQDYEYKTQDTTTKRKQQQSTQGADFRDFANRYSSRGSWKEFIFEDADFSFGGTEKEIHDLFEAIFNNRREQRNNPGAEKKDTPCDCVNCKALRGELLSKEGKIAMISKLTQTICYKKGLPMEDNSMDGRVYRAIIDCIMTMGTNDPLFTNRELGAALRTNLEYFKIKLVCLNK
jgi:hypothetical protein